MLTSVDEFNQQLDAHKTVAVLFTASWSDHHSHAVSTLQAFSGKSAVVDFDAVPALAATYAVDSVPYFLIFESGKVVERLDAHEGVTDDVTARLNRHAPDVDVQKFIPKGFKVLNDIVHFGDFEALNAVSDGATSDVLRLDKGGVWSDADSQMILYVPFTNICKIHSVLVKLGPASNGQLPDKIKIWSNRSHIVSFEDAEAAAPHEESLSGGAGWYQCRLKYVRFQNVQNLNIFFDGPDEDDNTAVEQVVVVGVSGDETDHSNLADKLGGPDEE